MKLLHLLIKPKWKNKNAAVRRDAVTTLHDVELLVDLPRLVREDADASVRLAALRRLNDYETWRERSTGDADVELRRTARAAYLGLLATNQAGVPPLARRIAELDTLAADEIEKLATTAVDVNLRGAALERVQRISLLVERAVADSDPTLRQAALARVDDASALLRIAERARKSDKLVSRLARERAEAARIAAGDIELIATRARRLCERSEALLQVARGERSEELAAIREAWKSLAEYAPIQLRERFAATIAFLDADTDAAAAVRDQLRALRDRIAAVPGDAVAIESVLAEASNTLAELPADFPERVVVEDAVSQLARRMAALAVPASNSVNAEAFTEDTEALAAKARFDAALANAQTHSQREHEREHTLRHQIDVDVITLEQRLEQGDFAGARDLRAQIESALRKLPEIVRHGKRLAHAFARYDELRRWQHWSNNERRKALCAEIEALPAAGLHPDAVATRVREARSEWQQLDASEGLTLADASERPTQGLARRFQVICNQALKPTREYFFKRQELRETQRDAVERVLADAAALSDESTDWPTWSRQRRATAGALRSLDSVEPRERKVLAQRLKDALTRIDIRLDAHAKDIEATKHRLIVAAEQAAQNVDLIVAAREIKDLQARWKTAGFGRRKTDEAQWHQFRALADAVFGKLDADRRQREQREIEMRADAEATMNEFAALLDGSDEISHHVRRELEQRWAALGLQDRTLERRWRELQERADDHAHRSARKRRLDVFADARARLALCLEIENGLDRNLAVDRWQALPPLSGALGEALHRRFEISQVLQVADKEVVRDLLVQFEYLGAIESPENDRQRRMDAQIVRLSRRLGGDALTTLSPCEELLALLTDWVGAGRTDATMNLRFEHAIDAAIARLP